MQKADTLGQSDPQETAVLQKSKNPTLDRMLHITPKAAVDMVSAEKRLNCTLDSVEKVKSQPLQALNDTLASPIQALPPHPHYDESPSLREKLVPTPAKLPSDDEEPSSSPAKQII